MIKDYYQILEISYNSDAIIIKKAFRKKAMQFHPDINKSTDAQEIFIRITEAYEVLIDYNKRKEYDLLYYKYFLNDKSIVVTNQFESSRRNEWSDYGQKKANEYSNLNLNEFMKYVFNETLFHGKNISKIGCTAYIWIGGGVLILIGFPIYAIEEAEINIYETLFGMLFGIIVIVSGVIHVKKQIKKYKQDIKGRKK